MKPEIRLQNLIDYGLEGLSGEEPSNVNHDLRAVIKDITQLQAETIAAYNRGRDDVWEQCDRAISERTQAYNKVIAELAAAKLIEGDLQAVIVAKKDFIRVVLREKKALGAENKRYKDALEKLVIITVSEIAKTALKESK